MGSGVGYFNVFIHFGGAESQSQCPQTPAFEEKGELQRNRTNITCLPAPQLNARPTGVQMDMVI